MERIIRYGSFSQGYLIADGENVIAVDGGKLPDEETFVKTCTDNGIEPHQIRLIVVTHGHEDHYDNVCNMKKATGAPVLCHKNAVESLVKGLKPKVIPRNEVGQLAAEAGKRIDKMMKEGGEQTMPPMLPPRPVNPDVVVENQDISLEPYGICGKIIYTPGHSDSCISVLLESGAAFTGDLIVTEPDSQRSTIAMYTYREGTDSECQNSVKRILETAEIYYAGHGGPFSKSEVQTMLDAEPS